MSTEKMREEFEKWWLSEMNVEVMDLHRCEFPMQKDGFVQPYACHETQRGWLSWQASRADIEIELSAPCDLSSPDGWCEYDCAKRAIEAAGLRIKP